MVVDSIMSMFFGFRGIDPKILPKHFIKKRLLLGRKKELFVILPGWHGEFSETKNLEEYLYKKGYSVLNYELSGSILSSEAHQTEEAFEIIMKEVCKEIEILKKKYGFPVTVIGISLGCISATMIANHSNRVGRLILICPGSSLLDSLWNGIKTKRLKRDLKERGYSYEKLKKEWKNIDPISNIGKLKGKKIKIFLSKADTVIPYTFGKKLQKAQEARKLDVETRTNLILGHYGTILAFLAYPDRFLRT